ncbi:MAG: hypothetical protein QXM22_02240 [Candidatus Bathyarchaeia archaeon]
MKKEITQTAKNLQFGDLIEVDWLDASEASGRLESGKFDTPVRSVGYFLGLKGRKTKYLVIAKELVRTCDAFHYNVIPLGMVETINIVAKEILNLDNISILKKFVHSFLRRPRQNDGWIYFEATIKKTIH